MQASLIKPVLGVYTALFLLFLYGPFVVLAILSFQTGPNGGPQFPIIEWSTYWYRHVFGLTPPSRIAPLPIYDSLTRSLILAVMTMIVSTVLGVTSAQAFRSRFKGSGVVFYLIVLGMMVPGVLVGLGLALVANILGIDRNWWSTAFVLHVVYTFPFAFLVMLAIFNRFDSAVEEAAWSLGVSPIKAFRKVTFPLIFPGVLSAMLFAFTLSYDEFSRTLFSSGRDLTLPLAIYGTIYAILMTLSIRRAKRFAIQEET
jgi:putative spermidine/putrescine transport system permease protein